MFELVLHGAELLALHGDSSGSISQQAPVRLPSNSRTERWQVIVAVGRQAAHAIATVSLRSTSEKSTASLRLSTGVDRKLRSRGFERLRVDGDERWRAYRLVSSPGDGDGNSGKAPDRIIIFRSAPTESFMALLPDSLNLADLALPGTHESCALYGFPVSQCQQPSAPCAQQLADGVRFLDVRLQVVRDQLLMFHGPRPQRSSWPQLIETLHAFLAAQPGETVVVCLKEENPPAHPCFASYVWRDMQAWPDMWWLEDRVPSLGEARGKAVLFSRFDTWSVPVGGLKPREKAQGEWEDGIGIHPSKWPDSRREGFEWVCHGRRFRIQDWYRVPSFLHIPEKFEALTTHLSATVSSASDPPDPAQPFSLSYASAATFPLALPTVIAKGFGWPEWGLGVEGMNVRLLRWLLSRLADGQVIRACVPLDFYRQAGGDGNDLAEILVQMNFM